MLVQYLFFRHYSLYNTSKPMYKLKNDISLIIIWTKNMYRIQQYVLLVLK